jgi:hypothetical protein
MSIFALMTTATPTMWAQMTKSIALGLDWRAPKRGRLAAYASISNLLFPSGSVQVHDTTLPGVVKDALLPRR